MAAMFLVTTAAVLGVGMATDSMPPTLTFSVTMPSNAAIPCNKSSVSLAYAGACNGINWTQPHCHASAKYHTFGLLTLPFK